jgi:phosphatidylglycerophosphatase A
LRNLLLKILASGFGTGYSPFASGTAGSLVGVLIYGFLPAGHTVLLAAIIIFFAGVFISTAAEKLYNKKDSGRIVIDEIAGYLFSMAFLPKEPVFAVAGFILFRFYDVVKPSPARESQNLKGGWGVMTDDLIAGIYTNLTLWAGYWIFKAIF